MSWIYRPDHPKANENGMVEKHLVQTETRGKGPNVISDYLPELRHPSTGKIMDSKSQFRAVTREKGCVEVGNEKQRDTRQSSVGGLKADIAQAYRELGE